MLLHTDLPQGPAALGSETGRRALDGDGRKLNEVKIREGERLRDQRMLVHVIEDKHINIYPDIHPRLFSSL